MGNKIPKLLILDVDGILCGQKYYGPDGACIAKAFHDHDWTAIKGFKSLGIPVVFLSGDLFNEKIADSRDIPFYYSRLEDGKSSKLEVLDVILKDFSVSKEEAIYLADDIFDICVLQEVGWAFCPKDSLPQIKQICHVLDTVPGFGMVDELLLWFTNNNILLIPNIDNILDIDAAEYRNKGKYCVYKISNKVNEKLYIGITNNPKVRWKTHINNALTNRNSCPKLYAAMRKYGVGSFEFKIIEYGNSSSWALRNEREYIEKYNCISNGYNCIANSVRNPMFGRKHSEISKTKMSETRKFRKVDVGENNSRAVWHYILFDPSGIEFQTNCLTTFCRENSLNRRSMADVCSGKLKSNYGWTGTRRKRDD